MIEFEGNEPILVFGGPYSNARATAAVLDLARRLGLEADRVICTGDVVAYCAEPNETVALVRDFGCHVIQGNCEQNLAARSSDCGCNFDDGSACARLSNGWYPYADRLVGDDERRWMGGLPQTLSFRWAGKTFRVVHGGCRMTARWVFQSEPHVIDEEIASSGADVTICGHTGLPFIAVRPGGIWFNAGVVGMPANDGTPAVWYGLISRDKGTGVVRLSTHRLDYDHVTTAAAMRRAGHANEYARTVITGLWPSLDILPEAERAVAGKAISPTVVAVETKAAASAS